MFIPLPSMTSSLQASKAATNTFHRVSASMQVPLFDAVANDAHWPKKGWQDGTSGNECSLLASGCVIADVLRNMIRHAVSYSRGHAKAIKEELPICLDPVWFFHDPPQRAIPVRNAQLGDIRFAITDG